MKGSIKANIERLRRRVDRPAALRNNGAIFMGILDVLAELDRQVERAREDADRALRGPYAD
jgi:hypothetical protein